MRLKRSVSLSGSCLAILLTAPLAAQHPISQADGTTPLHWAAYRGKLDLLSGL